MTDLVSIAREDIERAAKLLKRDPYDRVILKGEVCPSFPSEPTPPPFKSDPVDHPPHYNTGKIEVISAIEDWNLDFNIGNAVKYLARAGKKSPETYREDLKKAVWYIERQLNKK